MKELFTALAKAQKDFPQVEKNRTAKMGTYSYKYADISDVIEAIRKPLADNGLSFTQAYELTETGHQILKTSLHHSSGESQTSRMLMPDPSKCKPQDFGSTTTYYRRYSLASMLGISTDEDIDGNLEQKPKQQPAARPAQPAPKPPEGVHKQAAENSPIVSEARLKRMWAIAGKAGLGATEVKALAEQFGYNGSSKVMPVDYYNKICDHMESIAKAKESEGAK